MTLRDVRRRKILRTGNDSMLPTSDDLLISIPQLIVIAGMTQINVSGNKIWIRAVNMGENITIRIYPLLETILVNIEYLNIRLVWKQVHTM